MFFNGSEPSALKGLLIFSAVFTGVSLVLFTARKLAFHYLNKWASRTGTRVDDIMLESVRHPSVYWVLAISLYIALDTSAFPQKYVNYGLSALYVLIILSVTMVVANIGSRLVENAIQRTTPDAPVTGLSRTVIRAVIFGIGVLIILNGVGISITPILTALGVGGLAVALALQDTLSNLFSGIHLLVDRPIRVGDYVKLDSGEEGYVTDIGWRTTRIRELANNIIIIPNNKLSKSTIKNYYLPEKKMALLINIGVGYDSDPGMVEKVLVEEATMATGEIKGLLSEPAPFVRFIPGFGSSSIDFTLICQVEEFVDQYLVQHELRKRIFKRLKKEGIEIPYPTRTVRIKNT